MDLFRSETRGRQARHILRTEVEQYNENSELLNAAREQQILSIDDQLSNTIANSSEERKLTEIKDSVVAGIGARTTIANLAEGLSEGKSLETVARAELKGIAEAKGAGKIAEHVNSVANMTTEAVSMGEHGLAVGSELANEGKLASLVGAANSGKDVAEFFKGGSASILGKAGGFMNVGLGMYDLSEDFKSGSFDLEGNNTMEKAANALQIASGGLELMGLAGGPATIPLAALGAGLGVMSSVFQSVGEEQEVEPETAAQRSSASSEKAKLSIAPPKIIQSVPERIVGGVTSKVSG